MRKSTMTWLAGGMALAGAGTASAQTAAPACDDSLKAHLPFDAQTRVVMVRRFAKGETLKLDSAQMSQDATGMRSFQLPTAAADLCMVKLMVGPGNPGPADAPSTSQGIGIEIWLPMPERWNGRIHAIGGGGWVGGPAGSPAAIADMRPPIIAGSEGAVSSFTDGGHAGLNPGQPSSGGDFAMLPDGSINRTLWRDLSVRSLHEQAVKTEAVAQAFYGRKPRWRYFDGASQGGRQGYSLAQNLPGDYDGIIGNMPAINFTRFVTAGAYAQLLFLRELGGQPLSEAQQDFVGNAAIAACDRVGGMHLGYILDMAACRYDPVKDKAVLCRGDGGNSDSPACVTRKQAGVLNRIWFGLTPDGRVPVPAVDNGWQKPAGGYRRWYGLPRGTSLYNHYFSRLYGVNAGQASVAGVWTVSTDMIALAMQNPRLASPDFRNATGNGADGWKKLTYAELAAAVDRGVALDGAFANANTDNPDLAAFKARGGKLLSWHGLNDEMIPVQGTIRYYDSVLRKMGGAAKVQDFFRLYLVPGNGHGSPNGTTNPAAQPPVFGPGQFYAMLTDWVEQGKAPGRVEIQSPPGAPVAIAQPVCAYPARVTYVSGDPRAAASYRCR